MNNRLSGKIAVTRSFGDFSMKSKGLTSEPFVNKIALNDSDKFIVLCSDGIWDVVNEEDIFYLTLNIEQSEPMAKEILKLAIENIGNISLDCVVLDIKNAWESLGHITGKSISEEVVDAIFTKFCLGK